jgi:hypothetical protein
MMRLLILLFMGLLHFPAKTETGMAWRWYMSGFCSPSSDAKLCIRSGLANVRMQKGQISASLIDPQIPESPMTFAGIVSKQNTMYGALKGLSLHAPIEDKYQGSYRELQMGKKLQVRTNHFVAKRSRWFCDFSEPSLGAMPMKPSSKENK